MQLVSVDGSNAELSNCCNLLHPKGDESVLLLKYIQMTEEEEADCRCIDEESTIEQVKISNCQTNLSCARASFGCASQHCAEGGYSRSFQSLKG